jgi:hypothetical protein
LDGEWVTFENGSAVKISILQVATRSKVYLLDMIALNPVLHGVLGKMLAGVFTSRKLLKLGELGVLHKKKVFLLATYTYDLFLND